jgi:hypothetical protein
MNHHEFAHILNMIHGEMRIALTRMPLIMGKERKIALKIKDEIEAFTILPDEILTKEVKDGMDPK